MTNVPETKSDMTNVLLSVARDARSLVRQQTACPSQRRKAAKLTPKPPTVDGFRVIAAGEKDSTDQTKDIDAAAEYRILQLLAERLDPGFVVMTEERGILVSPVDFDPASQDSFRLLAIDPVDNTDLTTIGFGGAITLVAAEAHVEGQGERARVASAQILSTVICDMPRAEYYWAEKEQGGAFVDFQDAAGDQVTEPLRPDRTTQWPDITLSCVNAKIGRIRRLFADLGWMSHGGQRLDENRARCIFHHGGPLPMCRVASGDIHAAFDALKGYKPIDLAGGLFLASKADCRCRCFGDNTDDWSPEELIVAVDAPSIGDQLLRVFEQRHRFIVTANDSVMDYIHGTLFSQEPSEKLEEMSKQIRKSRTILEDAIRMLREANRHDLAEIIDRLFTMSLAYFGDSHRVNPVEHMAITTRNMVEICLGEKVTPEELPRGVVAALLHDVGQGVGQKKIRKADVPEEAGPKREKVIQDAIEARRAHMTEGARLAELLLTAYNAWYGDTFTPGDIQEVMRLVDIHDNPSIQEYQNISQSPEGETWLFPPEDRLAMYHREADRTFMIERVDVDIARDLAKNQELARKQGNDPECVTIKPKARILANIRRFGEEAELYQQALGAEANAYGFWCGLLYRSDTAYSTFLRKLKKIEKLYNVDVARQLDARTDRVKIAALATTSSDYWKYQLKNHRETKDHASTVVMGMPFDGPFSDGLQGLVDALTKVFSQFEKVVFNAYLVAHMHATVSPARRTSFDLGLYGRDPREMSNEQRKEMKDRPLDLDAIQAAVAQTSPFEIKVHSGDIRINGRGEITFWGSAKTDEDKKQLAGLRGRLVNKAGFNSRDKGHAIHITLGTIGAFHRLTLHEKQEIADGIQRHLDSEDHQQYLHETTRIERVQLVHYAHRSLSKIDEPNVELPLEG